MPNWLKIFLLSFVLQMLFFAQAVFYPVYSSFGGLALTLNFIVILSTLYIYLKKKIMVSRPVLLIFLSILIGVPIFIVAIFTMIGFGKAASIGFEAQTSPLYYLYGVILFILIFLTLPAVLSLTYVLLNRIRRRMRS